MTEINEMDNSNEIDNSSEIEDGTSDCISDVDKEVKLKSLEESLIYLRYKVIGKRVEMEIKLDEYISCRNNLYKLKQEIYKTRYGVDFMLVVNEYITFIKSNSLKYPYGNEIGYPICIQPSNRHTGSTEMIDPTKFDDCLPTRKIWDAFDVNGGNIRLSTKAMTFSDFTSFDELEEIYINCDLVL